MHYMGYDDDDVEKIGCLIQLKICKQTVTSFMLNLHTLIWPRKVLHGCPQASVLTLLGIFSAVQYREPPFVAHRIPLLLCAFECPVLSALDTLLPQIKVPEFQSHTTVAADT